MPLFLHYILFDENFIGSLKKHYVQHARILIKEKQNSDQKCKGLKDGGIWENFWQLP